MASKKREATFASQAALDALVRFDPEISGLKALMKQAYEDRATGRAQARGTARSTISAVDEARPGVKKIYNDAGLAAANRAKTLVGSDVAHLGGVANSIKAASALEQAAGADRLGEDQTAALTDLSRRRVAAVEGRGFALQNTQREFVSTVAKLLDRSQDIKREQGAFQASEVGKLRQADTDRRTRIRVEKMGNQQSERNSLRSAGINPNDGSIIKDGPLDPHSKKNRPKPIAAGEQMTFNDEVSSALNLLKTDVDPDKKLGRHHAAPSLVNGEEAVKGKDKSGVTQTLVSAIKPHSELAVRVANDMYYDGHLSPATIKLLRQNRVRIKAIPGVTIFTPQQRAAQRAKRHPKPSGNYLHDIFNALGAGTGT